MICMTAYAILKERITQSGLTCPFSAENRNKEQIIVEMGKNECGKYICLTTVQHNNWCRINYYYEDGTEEEMFEQ